MHQLLFFRTSILLAFICSSALFLGSCSSDGNADEPVTDSVKTAYLSALKGVWVLSSYIEDIKGTRSPNLAFKRLNGNATLIIPAEGKGDSLQIQTSMRNHTDSAFTLYFKKGTMTKGLKTSLIDKRFPGSYFTLGFETHVRDTTAYLYQYSAKHVFMGSRAFVKVANKQPAGAKTNWAIAYMVRKLLFKGVYAIFDGDYPKNKVTMDSDGKITGYRDFKKYDLLTDYTGLTLRKDYIQFDTIPRENIFTFFLDEDSVKMEQLFRIMFVRQR